MRAWWFLPVFIFAVWLRGRLMPDPLVECDRAAER